MIQYGNKFKLMDADGTFVGLHEFVANINGSDRFYYRDEDGKVLVSEKGQWVSDYLPTIGRKENAEVKIEDVMGAIESTINGALKQFGDRFEKLLEEKMNEIQEQVAQVGKAENRIMTQEEYDLEILNGQFIPQFPQKFEAKKVAETILKEMKEQHKEEQRMRGSKDV